MNALRSLLVIAGSFPESQIALQRALVVARHFGARIELFSCDPARSGAMRSPHGYFGAEETLDQCRLSSKLHLEALRCSVAAEDITITTSCDCESAIHQDVARKVWESRPDLVVWCIAANSEERQLRLSSGESRLIGTCAAPLLLTRRRPWAPQPRLLAAVDVSRRASALSAMAVLNAAEYFAEGCGGELAIVVLQAPGDDGDARAALRRLGFRTPLRAVRVSALEGAAEVSLAEHVVTDGVDVLVLRGSASPEGNGLFTESLIECLDCDLLLLPAAAGARGARA